MMVPWVWPWRWRRAGSQDDQATVVEQLIADRSGVHDTALGAAAACVAVYASTLAAASYAGRWPLTAATREAMACEYLMLGQSVRRIDVLGGVPTLTPVSLVDVRGAQADPSTWEYHVAVRTPDTTVHATYPAGRILHWRHAPLPDMPWRGVPPLRRAPALGALAGALERSLTGEHAVVSSRLVTICLLYTSPSPRDRQKSRMPSSA